MKEKKKGNNEEWTNERKLERQNKEERENGDKRTKTSEKPRGKRRKELPQTNKVHK